MIALDPRGAETAPISCIVSCCLAMPMNGAQRRSERIPSQAFILSSMNTSVSVLILALCQVLFVAVYADEFADNCRLWLAPSHTSTKHITRYGIFAGKAYKQNETFPLPEIAIPLVDMVEKFNIESDQQAEIIDFIESRLWTSEKVGSVWEGKYSAHVLIPGIGSLPNFHTGISNVDFLESSVLLRERPRSPKSGTPHPSRGAITNYYNVTIRATKDVPAGMELFADFGDEWDGNYTTDYYQDKFTRYDYEIADEIIKELVDIYKEFDHLTLEAKEDVLDFVLDKILATAAGKHAKTIKSLIPASPRKLQKVLDAGGSFMYRYPDMIQSTEWLSTHGYCLDTLRMGQSTIPHAGRGAFATRSFGKGEIITLSPMLHIADKKLLEVYDVKTVTDPETGEKVVVKDRKAGLRGHQLLLNYCFSHPESSLLLFPLGSHVALINHDKEPNAHITWSRIKDNNLPNQHAFQDGTVAQLGRVDRLVVVMKVVATRPIKDGEEITINYGTAWEKAWAEYMTLFDKFLAANPHDLQAEDLRNQYRHKPFKIPSEVADEPYPSNVGTACFLCTEDPDEGTPQHDGTMDISQWTLPDEGDIFEGAFLRIVEILDRVETGDEFFYNYTVKAKKEDADVAHKVVNVPHKACTFVNKPLTSDMHRVGAFRSPIGLPDNIFPQAWRDLR